MTRAKLHLASSSPRRRQLLDSMGIPFTYAGVDIDESRLPGEQVAGMALRLACGKAAACPERSLPILGADTVVALGDRAFGKPRSEEDALDMLRALSGKTHQVLTAVALSCTEGLFSTTVVTDVRFRDIDHDEARAYWQSGEPADKAGSYAIQGLGGIFVESLTGSYSGVVGLPVFETAALLQNAGIDVLGIADRND